MDPSGTGIRAILSHYDDENIEKPIASYSRKLLSRERAYSTVELECLAVINVVQHFRGYLTGVPCVVVTDHECLQYLHKLRDKSSRLMKCELYHCSPTEWNTDLARNMSMLMLSVDKVGVRRMDQTLNQRREECQGALPPYPQTGLPENMNGCALFKNWDSYELMTS